MNNNELSGDRGMTTIFEDSSLQNETTHLIQNRSSSIKKTKPYEYKLKHRGIVHIMFVMLVLLLLALLPIVIRLSNTIRTKNTHNQIPSAIPSLTDESIPKRKKERQHVAESNVQKYLNSPCRKLEFSKSAEKEKNRKKQSQSKTFTNRYHNISNNDDNNHSCTENCEATIALLRHCEKASNEAREHCSYVGYERAEYLSTLFGNDEVHRWPVPSYLFALSPGERNKERVRNWREVETLVPLSQKFNLSIDYSFGLMEQDELIQKLFRLLRSGELCGKLTLICWKHADLPDLAVGLGCGPEDGCPKKWSISDFDSTWQIKYSYHKLVHSPHVSEIKKKKKKEDNEKWKAHPIWLVYGSVQSQDFDPLEFSKRMGGYNDRYQTNEKGAYWLDDTNLTAHMNLAMPPL